MAAVTGPWVGSSAKATTGERWMAQAGAKLRIGTPFWMSQMIGRNVWNAHIKISGENPANNNARTRGAWKGKYALPWVGNLDGRGELSGIEDSSFEVYAFGIGEPSKSEGNNWALALRGSGNFDVNWRVDTEDNRVFYFTNAGREFQGSRVYESTDKNAFWQWLLDNDGRSLRLSFTAY